MADKCDFHDDCFMRLYGKVEGMDDKLDHLIGEIHNRLHEGDKYFLQLDMRLTQVEKALASSSSGRTDAKRKAVGLGFDLLRLAIVAIVTAAIWAIMNGFKR